MTEYEILSFIHKSGNIAATSDLRTASLFSSKPDLLTDDLRFSYLAEQGYISEKPGSGVAVSLTEKGIARLDELEKERTEKADQRRHDWKLAIFTALAGAFLSQPLWSIIDAIIAAIAP